MISNSLSKLVNFVMTNGRRNDPDNILATIDAYAEKVPEDLIHLGVEKGLVLDRLIEEKTPSRILELGSFFGYSALRMVRLIKGELISLEIDETHSTTASGIIEYAGLSQRVKFIQGDASTTLQDLQGQFDFVLIDHYADNYLKHLNMVESRNLLAPGATIVADNVVIHEAPLKSYLKHVRHGGQYHSKTYRVNCSHLGNITDGMEASTWLGSPVGNPTGMNLN